MGIFVFLGALACPLPNQRAAAKKTLPRAPWLRLSIPTQPLATLALVAAGSNAHGKACEESAKAELGYSVFRNKTIERLNFQIRRQRSNQDRIQAGAPQARESWVDIPCSWAGVANGPLWASHCYLPSHSRGLSVPALGNGQRAALRRRIKQESPQFTSLLSVHA